MIDIVKTLREQHPDLGPYVVALRADSRAVAQAEPLALSEEARAWLAGNAPEGRIERRAVRLQERPGAEAVERSIVVAAFANGRELAAFALAWT